MDMLLALTQRSKLSCPDPITGRKQLQLTLAATYNNGGNMKFGLYPTVGKSVGFLNLLSNCCRNGTTKTGFMGITVLNNGCTPFNKFSLLYIFFLMKYIMARKASRSHKRSHKRRSRTHKRKSKAPTKVWQAQKDHEKASFPSPSLSFFCK